jgi:prepilin-type N-terminal cleavage/methylation domain-containing protein
MVKIKRRRQLGLSLTELLCVMAILLILMSLYLPAIARAYRHIRALLDGF